MEGKIPSIFFEDIQNLGITTKKSGGRVIVKISFEVEPAPPDVARLLYLNRQSHRMDVTIESPQAEFDLTFTPVNAKTGEIAPEELHKMR